MTQGASVRPVKEYRTGQISVAVWENEGKPTSITIKKAWKGMADKWSEAKMNFLLDEVPKLALLINEAYSDMKLTEVDKK
jgi:hypothetical protein